MEARSFRFMFIDITQEPMGPGIPFIISDKTVVGACKVVDSMYDDSRKMRIYQVPKYDGILSFLIMYNTGDSLPAEFVKNWYSRNVVEYVEEKRIRRARS